MPKAKPGQDLTDHIELQSGRFLNLRVPDVRDIVLEDIAHGLAHTCRYAGQPNEFYSVAEHTVLVAAKLRADGHSVLSQWAGLHHDDAEAYIGDVSRPLKRLLPEYEDIETAVWGKINEALSLGLGGDVPTVRPEVKAADNWALSAEASALLPSGGENWECAGLYDPEDRDFRHPVIGCTPTQARTLWLATYIELKEKL
jgi:hypothetical protein